MSLHLSPRGLHGHRPGLLAAIAVLLCVVAAPVHLSASENGVAGNQAARQITHIPNYQPVSGDLYRLVIDFGQRIGTRTTDEVSVLSYEILLQEDYTMQVPFIGEVSVGERSFQELRREIIERIANRVPNEYVDLQLLSPAVFDVLVHGSVSAPGIRTVTSLSRLVETLQAAGGIAASGSRRRVAIRRAGEDDRVYDTLRYLNEGTVADNPFLRPEDRVFVPRREQSITLSGAVHQPGEYEILPGETLGDIIELAGGLTPTADLSRLSVNRLDAQGAYGIQRIEAKGFLELEIQDGDRFSIPSTALTTDRVVIEGALFGSPTTGGRQTIPEGPIRTTLAFTPGMTLLGVLEDLGGPTPFADPQRSYINRPSTGEQIDLPDLNDIWSRNDRERDIVLQPGDYIVVPQTAPQVLVSGDVANPSSFRYTGGRTVMEYVLLAGGITREDAAERRFFFMDEKGALSPATLTTVVRPGDTIFVARPELITVAGQVNSPGRFPYNRTLTVGDYLLSAGGINTEESNQRRIYFVDEQGRRSRTELTEPVYPGAVIFLDRDGWGKFKKFARDFNVVQTFLAAVGVTITLNAIYDGGVIPLP